MWQEARKHERKLRGMMVDYKRRGERRREYYEKIKKDPAQFLQVHGRAYKIHLDSAVALAAESPVNMMPWQGDANNMIDRFDVRAHLDFILTYTPPLLNTATPEQESEERKCNYERYRGLVQNDFASISEEQCLYQIQMDELYGGLQRPNEDEKKKLAKEKATIGYTYEDSTVTKPGEEEEKGEEDDSDNSESEEDEGIPDIDVEVDVDELNTEQELDLNKMATPYGMAEGDFVRMLRKDKDELEAIKHAKALEAEKAMYSGRRSRRQRREFREKRLKGRQISPPSYARRDSPTYDPYKRPQSESSSESRSRSRSPGPEKITFITSFGGSDEEAVAAIQAPPPVHTPANSLHQPADAALPPALPPLPPTLPLIAPPLVPPLTHTATDAVEEGGTDDIPAPGRGGAPTRGPGVEEPTEEEEGGHGGDATGHSPAPMTEMETGRGTGSDTGTWDVASWHAGAHGPARTLDRGTVQGGGVGGGLWEAIRGGSAAVVLAPPNPPSPAAPLPPHTEEARPLPLHSVTS
ncbi:CLK4-associating serine/arginine rich protein-like isoform X6 [Oncorhynchus nerka]|uniref:CLK4-associating serine/arginine rich protein-like isoform X6 n=1 Tax=Oncorhynchus nerka TaxID=8023 RepID=UPI00113267D6|nr:CLK4-associating serine/arginine rich protein-like isoform X7 [Oncorhynchus nerka]XP_029536303.1 CLK4-associating serine/arginine rich protein-like isoform X7 [Oncorhynchus nerka]XP_029536304.1 CLK4-associating serine/arginine rich protein-like isoform X7 [Oncorhynchus nerka]